jgi:UDP-N-acetylglucosamine/UDP-N-acetylgalactosamine diphosphorylase
VHTLQGYKLELFIFDTFPMAEKAVLMEVDRQEQFAPVKNAPGSETDSPDCARQAILKLHAR